MFYIANLILFVNKLFIQIYLKKNQMENTL